MLTAAPIGEARNLGTYSRSLTGLQHRLEKGRAVVNLFASRDTLRQVIDEVGGRGISGPYSVSNPNGVSGTEKVEVVTRDRNQPALILSAVPLTRFVDYEFEPFSGRVLFRKPVPSMDERLNPVSVRITYEVDGGGETSLGGRRRWTVRHRSVRHRWWFVRAGSQSLRAIRAVECQRDGGVRCGDDAGRRRGADDRRAEHRRAEPRDVGEPGGPVG